MDYYENAGGPALADEFYAELWSYIDKAIESPEADAIRARDIRRVNLERFPFHLFRIVDDQVRILAVRHHRRRPALATHRR